MSAGSIRLGATIDGNDAALIDRVVPLVDVVEVTPDRWASFPRGQPPRIEAPALAALSGIAARRMLSVHGVGLSIASHDAWNPGYVGLLDQMSAISCRSLGTASTCRSLASMANRWERWLSRRGRMRRWS